MGALRDAFWGALGTVPPGLWHAVTWLGDSGLLLPAALLIAALLALAPGTRWAAWRWCLLFGAGGAAILVTKLAFLGWGVGSARLNFTGISGHTAIATSVWPVALWLLAVQRSARTRRTARIGPVGPVGHIGQPRPIRQVGGIGHGAPRATGRADTDRGWQIAAALAGWSLGAVIGVSRLALYAHSASEVVAGFVLGFAVSAAFLALARRQPPPRLPWPALVLGLLMPVFVLRPGTPAPTQSLLEAIATQLAGTERPFQRDDLLGPASDSPR